MSTFCGPPRQTVRPWSVWSASNLHHWKAEELLYLSVAEWGLKLSRTVFVVLWKTSKLAVIYTLECCYAHTSLWTTGVSIACTLNRQCPQGTLPLVQQRPVLGSAHHHVDTADGCDRVSIIELHNITQTHSVLQKQRLCTGLGDTHSRYLSRLAVQVWDWCVEWNITIQAEPLPGKQNVRADWESHHVMDSSNWWLHREILKLQESFGPFTVDLFASQMNAQRPVYWSWKPDPAALTVDALSISWKKHYPYMFPPFVLIPWCLNELEEETVADAGFLEGGFCCNIVRKIEAMPTFD